VPSSCGAPVADDGAFRCPPPMSRDTPRPACHDQSGQRGVPSPWDIPPIIVTRLDVSITVVQAPP